MVYCFLQHVFLGIWLVFGGSDNVYFKSERLRALVLHPIAGTYTILDDEREPVSIKAVRDSEGMLYWYRRIETPVCLTGECKLVDVGIYWYCTGDFMGLEVYGEHLTKTDHSVFSDADYAKLLSVLDNDWSSLREYSFAELLEPMTALPSDTGAISVDAVSAATNKEIASETVPDAVYTTYTLWHLIHIGEKEQLEQLTLDRLKDDRAFEALLIGHRLAFFQDFLLRMAGLGKLRVSDALGGLILEGLRSGDLARKNLAIRALSIASGGNPDIQRRLARIYPALQMSEKVQIVSALKDVVALDGELYQALANDLDTENEWFAIRILAILKHHERQADQVLEVARALTRSKNTYIKASATDFLAEVQN